MCVYMRVLKELREQPQVTGPPTLSDLCLPLHTPG